MQARIRELESKQNYKQGLKVACKTNGISCKLLNGLTLRKMEKIYKRTLAHYENSLERAQMTWFENQLRLFQWILLVESCLLDFPLNLFNEENWIRIQAYFYPKPTIMLEFECRRLLNRAESQFHIVWCEEESTILQKILEDKTLFGKWNEVSRQLFEISGKRFYRSGKQCREQWFNHLDHSKKHGQWKDEEDVIILREVLTRGHKWAQICKGFLPHRTEHMVKNRFKSLLIRYEKPKQKWNAHERRSIKRTLSKLVHVKAEMPSIKLNIEKRKTQPNSCEQYLESEQPNQKISQGVRNQLSVNLLSVVDNKLSLKQQQNYLHESPALNQPIQDVNAYPTPNSLPYQFWQYGSYAYPFFKKTEAEVVWRNSPQNYGFYSLGAWQPFGYMI